MPVIKNALLRYRVLDRCIRNEYHPFPSKEDLRQACEEELFGSSTGDNICHSTIEKDIFAMRMEHDAPIIYSRKERGYYYSDSNFSMDDIPLTESDISAIKAATSILNQFKNTQLFSQFQYAIDKILDRVNLSANNDQNYNDDVLHFETQPTVIGNEFLEPILNAIKQRTVIQFTYQSFQSEKSSVRRVHPYLLKEYRNRWYLIGKSELKNKIITFGLDRMSDLMSLSNHFVVDAEFNPDLFFKYSIGITTYDGQPQDIVLKADKVLSKYLLSQPLHHTQKSKALEAGEYSFSYSLLPSYELKMILLGFGDAITIIKPKSLAKDILLTAKKINDLYK